MDIEVELAETIQRLAVVTNKVIDRILVLEEKVAELEAALKETSDEIN